MFEYQPSRFDKAQFFWYWIGVTEVTVLKAMKKAARLMAAFRAMDETSIFRARLGTTASNSRSVILPMNTGWTAAFVFPKSESPIRLASSIKSAALKSGRKARAIP